MRRLVVEYWVCNQLFSSTNFFNVFNASFAIQAMEPAKPIEECVAIARESLESGKALNTLKKFVELNS